MPKRAEESDTRGNHFPYVSVIIPVFNARATLSMCLGSIRDLDYPRERLEVIVVDNGSKDGSVEIAERFGVRLLHETSVQSSYGARNRGVKAAKGALLAFTDSDCIVTRGWLKQLVRRWDDRTIGCFAGEIEAYRPETLVERFADRAGILRQKGTLKNTYLPYTQTANSAYRREVFDRVGPFNAELVSGGDADISWRMQKETGLRIEFVPEALVYHKHRTSVKGLYRQFKKYEHGKLLWQKYYPDYRLPSVRQRRAEFAGAVRLAILTLPGNLLRYLKRQIDLVDMASPFFRAVMAYGTFSARR